MFSVSLSTDTQYRTYLVLFLMVAYFRDLHGQLQTVTCIMTAPKKTTVQLYTRVIVLTVRRLHRGDDVFVVGPAVVGESLAGIG